ncbi:MAG TPA: hypothetical protein DD725_12475 [Deltaproteobacteria bacterium]|nr:hypothetical protein [Deltaproteobacteria bacterium]
MKKSLSSDPVKKIIIPQKENTYSSFPTFTEYDDKIFIFYRQAVKNNKQCHGIKGKVKCFEIEKELFLKCFENKKSETLYNYGNESIVFKEGNEFDAIVSRLDTNIFSLATRTYIKKTMKTFVSFSDSPVFKDRVEVKIEGIEWLAFYGKALKCEQGYVFPAYGQLAGETVERPLIIITNDFLHFELLSSLPSNVDGPILNESSIIYDGKKYMILMREETFPRGIWFSTSTDLCKWDGFERFLSFAHAPMAIYLNNDIYLTFRDLISEKKTGISLISTSKLYKTLIDLYEGSPYDGGYSDIGIINGDLFIIYYMGNKKGEPYIKCCRL